MRGRRLFGFVAVMGALHVAMLTVILGLRQTGYILTAMLSATLIWGLVVVVHES